MTEGINWDMPESEYFADPSASNSTLGRMKKSPAHCKEYMDNPPEETAAMKRGSLLHTLVLEPHLFNERYFLIGEDDPVKPRKAEVVAMIEAIQEGKLDELYCLSPGTKPQLRTENAEFVYKLLKEDDDERKFVVEPEFNKRTKAGKEEYQQWLDRMEKEGNVIVTQKDIDSAVQLVDWEKEVQGRTIVSNSDMETARNYASYLDHVGGKILINQDELDQAQGMASSVFKHKIASKLFASGKAEGSMFWTDPDEAFPCKARIDFLSDAMEDLVVDLKSTQDASAEEFKRSISKFGYHRQQAMYSDGYRAIMGRTPKFVFVVVESSPPYAVAVYRLDEESERQGRIEYKDYLEAFVKCKREDSWPGYPEEVLTIELPSWHK